MGHSIQVIVAPIETALRLRQLWPELCAYTYDQRHIVFPIDADLIDAKIAPEETPRQSDETFILLDTGLKRLLAMASVSGVLAYLETDYFGGHGGQGAVVFENGRERMPPEWAESDTINRALRLIGVRASTSQDEFLVVGLGMVRNNDDFAGGLSQWEPNEVA